MGYEELVLLLKSEVKLALGCTEPAAVALTVAQATNFLGGCIDNIEIEVSVNIYKNALMVTIPNTRESGLELAAALGMLVGDPEKGLAIFADITAADVMKAKEIILLDKVKVHLAKEQTGVYIKAKIKGNRGSAEVLVSGGHTNMIAAMVNGSPVSMSNRQGSLANCNATVDITGYTFMQIVSVIETVPIGEIFFLQEGIEMNLQISQKGLELNPGLAVGAGLKVLLDKGAVGDDLVNRARMAVAAACDARMAGLNYPVMSTMGSGNQGLEATIPVVIVARALEASQERILRALALSHLVTAFVKQHTGTLSPICGCSVAAGAGAAASIAWLMGGKIEGIQGAVKNIIGSLTGMICDGAKGGCALKLSASAGEAIIAAQLALQGVIVGSKDGIICDGVEDTIRNLGRLSWPGMACADEAILGIMLNKERQDASHKRV